MTLEEITNRAAGELPEGWIIEINIENGAGWVEIYDDEGTKQPSNFSGSLSEQVAEALDYAKRHARNL